MIKRSLFALLSVIGGIVLMLFSLFIIVSVATYNKQDPTIFHANNNSVLNLGGALGANFADIILQSIGSVFIYPLLFLIVLSIRMMNATMPRYVIIRSALLLIILPIVCGSVNLAAKFFNVAIISSGFLGDYVAIEITQIITMQNALMIFPLLSLLGFILSIGLKFREWYALLKLTSKAFALVLVFFFKASLYLAKKFRVFLNKKDIDFKESLTISSKRKLINVGKSLVKENQEINDQDKKSSVPLHGQFVLPSVELLQHVAINSKTNINKELLEKNGALLSAVLTDFGIIAELIEINPGPVVTLYEFEPAAGTKSARVIGLADDIARSMKSISARIAVIPGKNAIGIELPNAKRETVYLREMLESSAYKESQAYLPLILGKNIGGTPIVADLTKMPHVLVAGTTGSGKSVAINTMILSLLYRYSPEVCKFVMIDPKMLELSVYDGIPHLLSPVVTDSKKAVIALKWVVKEMEERYRAMSTLGVRNINGYNKAVIDAVAKGKSLTKTIQTGFDRSNGKPIFEKISIENKELPYLVVIVDEMADLMLVAGKEIEAYIQRLAQMARAAGIHIIMATQRPSVDVITGVIKANLPTRISFQVSSKIDSRTVLGEQGAEQLLGMGDMLYMMPGGKIERVHGPFVDDKEVENVVEFWKKQGEPQYIEDITAADEDPKINDDERDAGDDLYKKALDIVMHDRKASTSYIQRSLKIGYNRAANIIEKMEKEGVVSPPNHVGKREVLI